MTVDEVANTIKKYGWQMGIIVVGLGLMGGGLVVAQQQTKGEQLVILSSPKPQATQIQEIVVDIEGAVEKPGVHKLSQGSRISDAVIAAGGLAADADRSWVARFVNQAELVKDGMKIYIPVLGEKQESITRVQETNEVSINTASERELDELWGVGAARAKAIIQNRPYGVIDELVTKAKIPQDVIDNNKDKIGL
jgi:competence protein ComEA